MKRALIIIDYTCDFVADDGALTCGKPAQDLDQRISQLVQSFHQDGDFIVVANDTHIENDPYHPETQLFPPHNIQATAGIQVFGRTGQTLASLEGSDRIKWMPKTRYSAFAGTDLYLRLRERGIDEIHLVGVCTDICVLHTAVDAYNLGFKTVIHKDGVASFNQVGHEWALTHFKDVLGATVVEGGTPI